MLGRDFPVSDYYKNRIIDAETLTRGGGWWTAVLLISDPHTEKSFVALYKWQQRGGEWKRRQNFILRSKKDIAEVVRVLSELAAEL